MPNLHWERCHGRDVEVCVLQVVWADHYEPYILMERALMPSYDNEFFLNYDKISFTARLALSGLV
jgi:hypothetical protein